MSLSNICLKIPNFLCYAKYVHVITHSDHIITKFLRLEYSAKGNQGNDLIYFGTWIYIRAIVPCMQNINSVYVAGFVLEIFLASKSLLMNFVFVKFLNEVNK